MSVTTTSTAMKAPKTKPRAKCPSCDVEAVFAPRIHEVEQIFRGETLRVISTVTVCQNCGFEILVEGQLDELASRTRDAYRARHKLLTAKEIVAARKSLGMTQERFAKHLSVSLASVKRWETGYVQDKISDKRIREKMKREELPLEELVHTFLKGGERLTLEDISAESLNRIYETFVFSKFDEAPETSNMFVRARSVEFLSKILRAGCPQLQTGIAWCTVATTGASHFAELLMKGSEDSRISLTESTNRLIGASGVVVSNRPWKLNASRGSRPQRFDEESSLELTA